MAKKIASTLVPLSRAAKALDLDRATLGRYRRRGMPTTPGKGGAVLVDVDRVRAWMEREGLGQRGRSPAVVEALRGLPQDVPQAVQQPQAEGEAPQGVPQVPAAEPLQVTAEDLERAYEVFDGLDARAALELRPDAVKKLAAVAAARRAMADAQKRELAVARERGQLLDAAEVERGQVTRIMVVKSGLTSLGARLASVLPGLGPEEVRAIIDTEVDSLLRQFSEKFRPL